MRAIRFERFGAPSELQLQEIPRPAIREDEALIRVHAAAVNPSDAKNVQGVMANTTLPRTPGRDYAGVVAEGPQNLIGMEVWGTGGDLGFTRDGTHAEYLAVPAGSVHPKPSNLTMEEAGAVGVGYLTAWLALIERAHLVAGESVLIVGGAGAVGTAATQIAKWNGARTIATVLNETEGDEEWRRGVDIVVNLKTSELAEAVLAATEGKGVNVVFNTVGGPTFEPGVKALGFGGRLVAISATGERRVSFDLLDFYRRGQAFFGLDTRPFDASACAPILDRLRPGFESGALRIKVARTYPLEEAVDAYERVLQGSRGKIVLTP